MNNLNPLLLARIVVLVSLMIAELTPPHNPLSEVIGTNIVLDILNVGCFFYR